MENYFSHKDKERNRDQGKYGKPVIDNSRYGPKPSHTLNKQNTGYTGHAQGAKNRHSQEKQ